MAHKIATDTCSLMRQLSAWANMKEAGITQMVLVLDIDSIPVLYVRSLVRTETPEIVLDLPEKVEVVPHDECIAIDTTTLQNEVWRSALPIAKKESL